jgi:hypothetical protein
MLTYNWLQHCTIALQMTLCGSTLTIWQVVVFEPWAPAPATPKSTITYDCSTQVFLRAFGVSCFSFGKRKTVPAWLRMSTICGLSATFIMFCSKNLGSHATLQGALKPDFGRRYLDSGKSTVVDSIVLLPDALYHLILNPSLLTPPAAAHACQQWEWPALMLRITTQPHRMDPADRLPGPPRRYCRLI